MKKYMLITIIALFLLFSACDSGTSALNAAEGFPQSAQTDSHTSMPPEEIIINLMEGVYIYDVDVPEQAAYYHDNIFTATVVEVGENYDPYWEPEYVEKHGSVPVYNPCYTKYKLQVVQVIKGDLQKNDIIEIKKLGYYDDALQEYVMIIDDVMPELGKEYLFLSNKNTETGLYTVSTPNSTIPLEQSDLEISTYAPTDDIPDRQIIINKYIEAYENETPYVENTSSNNGPTMYTDISGS